MPFRSLTDNGTTDTAPYLLLVREELYLQAALRALLDNRRLRTHVPEAKTALIHRYKSALLYTIVLGMQ